MGGDIAGARMADLFAGSGSLGIEALSRGAAEVHFLESHGRTAALLEENVAALGLRSRATVVRGDAFAWLRCLAAPLDIVLADPPYGPASGALLEQYRLAPFAGQLWLEHRDGDGLAGSADWSRAYGGCRISRFRRPESRGRERGPAGEQASGPKRAVAEPQPVGEQASEPA